MQLFRLHGALLCYVLFRSIVVKIALDEYYGRTLVARARRKVAERADKIGQTPWRRTLGRHISDEVFILLDDLVFDSFL